VAAASVPVLATSRVDLALATGAAGVHLVEGDIAVADARRLAPGLLVGRSVHSAEAAEEAAAAGADYILLGPIWGTPSHPDARGLGLDALRAAALAARPVPVLAVGGVDAARTERVMRAGAAGWAAIRMFA
jgi:thiamine-phosphate pyrophosphorylase